MKKYILILILYFLTKQPCLSQSNHLFPDSSASWSATQIIYGGPGDPWVYSSGRLAVDGDTSISGMNYKKLFWFDYCDSIAVGIVGYYRVDSMKVYYRDDLLFPLPPFVNMPYVNFAISDTGEVLLYDFALQVGDTFQFRLGITDSVSLIDSVLLDGSYYKRISFQNMYTNGSLDPYYWIEGVGCTYGFFPAYFILENALFFNCFTTYTDTITFNGPCPCSPVGLSENMIRNSEIRVFPNPFINTTRISFPTSQKHTLRIFNILGNEVKFITFNGKEFDLELDDLKQGVYFISIEGENSYNSKIIIQ